MYSTTMWVPYHTRRTVQLLFVGVAMSVITTRNPSDFERLTISVRGSNRGQMFSELGNELGRLLPTTGQVLETEEFSLSSDSLPELLSVMLEYVKETLDQGITYTLWNVTFSFQMPGNLFKLYVLAHVEELADFGVDFDMVATKWFASSLHHGAEQAEIILRMPSNFK